MAIKYFERWVRLRKAGAVSLSEEEARRRHESGRPYVAVISRNHKDSCVVDIAGQWVSVLFLDENGRVYLTYDFKDVGEGRVFLAKALHREFGDFSDAPSVSISFVFGEDGVTWVERTDHMNSTTEQAESASDVSPNYDLYPQFGAYDQLCREERG